MSKLETVLNYPLTVIFAGFESNTLRLQEAGWSLAMNQNYMDRRISLAMRHESAGLYGLTSGVEFDFFRYRELRGEEGMEHLRQVRFYVQHMGTSFQSRIIPGHAYGGKHPWDLFEPIDARPMVVDDRTLDSFNIFRALPRGTDVIVNPKDVPGLMELVLKAQAPTQAEIRDRQRRAMERGSFNARPDTQVHAQIISLAG
jgi:hypothetical protein